MPTTSNGLRYPASSAAPNIPQDIQNLATDLNDKTIRPMANQTAINAITSPYIGQTVVDQATKRRLYWSGTAWVKFGGPPEVLYTSSDWTPRNSGSVANGGALTVNVQTVTLPVAADTGQVHIGAIVSATSATGVGTVTGVFGSTTAVRLFNVGTTGTPVDVVFPFSAAAGAGAGVSLELRSSAGSTVQITVSSVRVTI